MSRMVDAVIAGSSLRLTRVKKEKELRFTCDEPVEATEGVPATTQRHWRGVSFSKKLMETGPNAGKTMRAESVARMCDNVFPAYGITVPDIPVLDGNKQPTGKMQPHGMRHVAACAPQLDGKPIQLQIGTYFNETTQEEQETVERIIFAGEKPPSMDVDEWADDDDEDAAPPAATEQ